MDPTLAIDERTLIRADLVNFARHVTAGGWRLTRHLEVYCDELMDAACGRTPRLIVNMPARHGKSRTGSRIFPAWYLINNPDHWVILTSYGASLAYRFSREVREHIRVWGWYLNRVRLSETAQRMDLWELAKPHEGGLVAAGVGGPITGHGGNLMILDDVIKNAEEANSQTYRDYVWEWYRSTFRTRLEPGGSIVIITTRWHYDDLVGRLLAEMEKGETEDGGEPEHWRVINMPAMCEDEGTELERRLGRRVGDPLWVERYSAEDLRALKASVGSRTWAAVYQQRPEKSLGHMFQQQHFRYFTEEAEFYVLLRPGGEHRVRKADCFVFQTVDPALKEKQENDYFACGTWAATPESDLLLLNVLHERIAVPKHKAVMHAQYARYLPACQAVEDAVYGTALIMELTQEGLPVVPVRADADKVTRAIPLSARYEAGTVYHRVGAPWLAAYEDELKVFPEGKHDDQVDMAAYAARILALREQYARKSRGVGKATVIGA